MQLLSQEVKTTVWNLTAEVCMRNRVEGNHTMQVLKTRNKKYRGKKQKQNKTVNIMKCNSFSALGIRELKIKIIGVFLPYLK